MSLSIVTITYNDPAGLLKTIESLKDLPQTGLDWEHIIIDASPGANAEVFAKLPSHWPLVHITEEPRGIYSAQNSGLNNSRKSVVWFLNGGDRLKSPGTLKHLSTRFEKETKLDLLCAGADLYRGDAFLYPRNPTAPLIKNILGSNRICHQALLYRRSSLLSIGPFREGYRLAADYEHLFRCYVANLEVAFTAETLVEYQMDGQSGNYRDVFQEFRKVHRTMRTALPLWAVILNEVAREVEGSRLSLLKALARSPAAGLLRPLWLAWNRRGAR